MATAGGCRSVVVCWCGIDRLLVSPSLSCGGDRSLVGAVSIACWCGIGRWSPSLLFGGDRSLVGAVSIGSVACWLTACCCRFGVSPSGDWSIPWLGVGVAPCWFASRFSRWLVVCDGVADDQSVVLPIDAWAIPRMIDRWCCRSIDWAIPRMIDRCCRSLDWTLVWSLVAPCLSPVERIDGLVDR
jgi:hypothetical protein